MRIAVFCLTYDFNSTRRSRGFFCILFSATGKKFVREATELKIGTRNVWFCINIEFLFVLNLSLSQTHVQIVNQHLFLSSFLALNPPKS